MKIVGDAITICLTKMDSPSLTMLEHILQYARKRQIKLPDERLKLVIQENLLPRDKLRRLVKREGT